MDSSWHRTGNNLVYSNNISGISYISSKSTYYILKCEILLRTCLAKWLFAVWSLQKLLDPHWRLPHFSSTFPAGAPFSLRLRPPTLCFSGRSREVAHCPRLQWPGADTRGSAPHKAASQRWSIVHGCRRRKTTQTSSIYSLPAQPIFPFPEPFPGNPTGNNSVGGAYCQRALCPVRI